MFLSLIFLPVLLKAAHLQENLQEGTDGESLVCYDFGGQSGDQLRTSVALPDLRTENFGDRIESCCVHGLWILYADDQYNNASTTQESWCLFMTFITPLSQVRLWRQLLLRPSGGFQEPGLQSS